MNQLPLSNASLSLISTSSTSSITGDVNRPEVLRNFNVGKAKACVFTIDDMMATNRAVITLRKMFPDLPLVVRAKNSEHQRKLENMFGALYSFFYYLMKLLFLVLLLITS